MELLQRMGPLAADHPLVVGEKDCPGCHGAFEAGQTVTLIVIGPGDDAEARKKAREGGFYNAVSIPVHWPCATGEEE